MTPPAIINSDEFLVGRFDANGAPLVWSLTHGGHVRIEGVSGGGKSTLMRRWTDHLVALDDVLVAGTDIKGDVLGRWPGTQHDPWQMTGWDSLGAHADTLERVADLVDHRAATGDRTPRLVVVVFDEWVLLLRLCRPGTGAYEYVLGEHRSEALRQRIVDAYRRIMTRGAAADVRVILASQCGRSEGYPSYYMADEPERATPPWGYCADLFALRVSFAGDPLHFAWCHGPDAVTVLAAQPEHAPTLVTTGLRCPAPSRGHALVSVPGHWPVRLRTEAPT